MEELKIDSYQKMFHQLKKFPTECDLVDEYSELRTRLQACAAQQNSPLFSLVSAEYYRQKGDNLAAIAEYEKAARLNAKEIDALLSAAALTQALGDKKCESSVKISRVISYLQIAAQRTVAQKDLLKASEIKRFLDEFQEKYFLVGDEKDRVNAILSLINPLIIEDTLIKQYENKSVPLETLAQQNYLPAIHALAKKHIENTILGIIPWSHQRRGIVLRIMALLAGATEPLIKIFLQEKMHHSQWYTNIVFDLIKGMHTVPIDYDYAQRLFLQKLNDIKDQYDDPLAHVLTVVNDDEAISNLRAGLKQALNVDDGWIEAKLKKGTTLKKQPELKEVWPSEIQIGTTTSAVTTPIPSAPEAPQQLVAQSPPAVATPPGGVNADAAEQKVSYPNVPQSSSLIANRLALAPVANNGTVDVQQIEGAQDNVVSQLPDVPKRNEKVILLLIKMHKRFCAIGVSRTHSTHR